MLTFSSKRSVAASPSDLERDDPAAARVGQPAHVLAEPGMIDGQSGAERRRDRGKYALPIALLHGRELRQSSMFI
jgi:hypothetical protein